MQSMGSLILRHGRNAEAIDMLKHQPIQYRISHLVARLFFRGIYFPQMKKRDWIKLLLQNRGTIFGLTKEGFSTWRAARKRQKLKTIASQTA